MAPHLKYRNKNLKMQKLHFAVDNKNKRLIVADCGDHMTNDSTRKNPKHFPVNEDNSTNGRCPRLGKMDAGC